MLFILVFLPSTARDYIALSVLLASQVSHFPLKRPRESKFDPKIDPKTLPDPPSQQARYEASGGSVLGGLRRAPEGPFGGHFGDLFE